MATAVVVVDQLSVQRGQVWKIETGGLAIAPLAYYKLGWVTGGDEVVVTNRIYVTTASRAVISLHEGSFSGGAPARKFCRRLSSNDPFVLTTCDEGVVATLGAVITQGVYVASTSTGNAAAGIIGESLAVILKANTSYVVSLLNEGNQAGDMFATFDFRALERHHHNSDIN